jgi:hypothetical protein
MPFIPRSMSSRIPSGSKRVHRDSSRHRDIRTGSPKGSHLHRCSIGFGDSLEDKSIIRPHLDKDRVLSKDIESVVRLMRSGKIVEKVEGVIGELT